MIVYHEADQASVPSIVANGLKCTSRGKKGGDLSIIRTDQFLDSKLPRQLKKAGVSRDDNLYAYVSDGTRVVDIASGKIIDINDLARGSEQAIMRLEIDPGLGFVSDLDAYDAVREAIKGGESSDKLQDLAKAYWDMIIPLGEFRIGKIRRPEVMVISDVGPERIDILYLPNDT